VGVTDGARGHTSSRGNVPHMSRRAASISSALRSTPRSFHNPYRERNGCAFSSAAAKGAARSDTTASINWSFWRRGSRFARPSTSSNEGSCVAIPILLRMIVAHLFYGDRGYARKRHSFTPFLHPTSILLTAPSLL